MLPQTGLRRYVEAGMSPAWAALTHSITGRGATNLTKRIAYYTGWAGSLPSFWVRRWKRLKAHFFWIRKRWRRISGCTAAIELDPKDTGGVNDAGGKTEIWVSTRQRACNKALALGHI